MTNDEIKILSNMSLISLKLDNKELYTEEDYFYIFQLIDGYKHLEKYFSNRELINSILSIEIKGITLYRIIKTVRNRYAHIDKHNEIDKLVLLQTKVKKEDIHRLIREIKKEMDIIFSRNLNSDVYKLIMNTKIITNIFETISSSLHNEESLNELAFSPSSFCNVLNTSDVAFTSPAIAFSKIEYVRYN